MNRIRFIAMDMDGTLLLSDHHTMPRQNIEAIRRADAAGIRMCICTGRMLEDISDFIRRFDIPCMIIASNGARVSEGPLPEGRILLRRQFARDEAHRVLDLLLPFGLMVNVFEDGLVSTVMGGSTKPYHLVRRGLVRAVYGEAALRAAADRGIMKIFMVNDDFGDGQPDERVAMARTLLCREMPHLQIVSSGPGNVEVMPANTGKGAALAQIASDMGLTREQVMAVGDADNDLSMMTFAYHSVAMANAASEVRSACRWQTESNDECGVARIIHRVLAAKEAAQ